jgi:cobalt-zinc-cadmium efflux system protein
VASAKRHHTAATQPNCAAGETGCQPCGDATPPADQHTSAGQPADATLTHRDQAQPAPATAQPTDRSSADDDTDRPGAHQAGTVRTGAGHSSAGHSGAGNSGADHSGGCRSGADHSGADHPSTSHSGGGHDGADHPGADHSGHSHGIDPDADRRYLWTAFGLIAAFMAAEVVVGLVVGSLVLLADAAHMVTDAGAIGLALFAMRLAARPAAGAYTFGLKRAEILSALANGATLLALGLFFVIEGIGRLVHPPDVAGGAILAVALAGVAVNVAATLILSRANRRSLNVEGSFQHILTDLYAFIGTAIAGVIILTTGFARADAIASLLVAGLMIKAGVELVRESGRVVLEASPRRIDPNQVRTAILAAPGVLGVHELHVWEVTSGFPALSAHVLVDTHRNCHERRAELERLLSTDFDIRHTTLQVDHTQGAATRHLDDPDCPTAP